MSNPTEEKETNYLDMSDEEMMNTPPPNEETKPEQEDPAEQVEEKEEQEQEEAQEQDDSGKKKEEEASEDEEDPSKGSDEEEEVNEQEQKQEKEEKAPAKKEKEKQEPSKSEQQVDYEAEYKKLLAPIKANGREVEVRSVEDAQNLMRMGIDYSKRMAGIKPHRKVLKLLESNGLLNEEKLSYLIDLSNKNPEAINKLVSDSGINPMEFDTEKAGEYKQKIHTVDDRAIALDTVLDEIEHTETYNRTLGIVSKEWDDASKQVIADHPQLLHIINDHVGRGIYDQISKEVDRERMLGRLVGLSDLDAYRKVGDSIQAAGGFNHLGSSQENTESKPKTIISKPSKADDAGLKDKKRAASSSKSSGASKVDPDFNPLALSDEDFSKLAEKRFR